MKQAVLDFKDGVQTDPSQYPMRIGPWKTVLLSVPFTLGGHNFIAHAIQESEESCGRYTACVTSYFQMVIITLSLIHI